MTANFSENSPGSKYQSDSMIQESSRGAKKGESKTNRDRKS